ncbi:hypothetical protein CPC08DRAFT_706610 [Agrocybe pediades]|nr:hypothetical protein CPC08DRAFT_706610 [Agrocybe pediades]
MLNLPQEIVDHIIDHTQACRNVSKRDLSACSLVSRPWRYRSQRYIFQRNLLIFNGGKYSTIMSERVRRIAELLDSPLEGITNHVRTLTIRLRDTEEAILSLLQDSNWTTIFKAIFRSKERSDDYSIFLDVGKLNDNTSTFSADYIWAHGKMDWRVLPQDFTHPLLDTIQSGHLKHLCLSQFTNIPISFFEISTLDSIGLNSMVFKFNKAPYAVDNHVESLDARNMFFLKAFDIPEAAYSKFDFAGVQALRCALQQPVDWFDTSMMVKQCSSSLESLKIIVGCPSTIYFMINLTDLKNLKKLTVMNTPTERVNILNPNVMRICEVLLQANMGRANLQSPEVYMPILEELNLQITLGSTDQLGGLLGESPLVGYFNLDQILALSPMLRFAKVITIHFFFPSAADVEHLNDDAFRAVEEDVKSRAEAALPMISEARASIGPLRIVVDVGPPETDVF